MYFKKIRKTILTIFILQLALISPSYSYAQKTDELDVIRTELSYIKDKNSPQYIKTKQKLQKFIAQNKIDYSQNARLEDVLRLISQQKYNCAVWELNDLIEEGYKLSTCYELLGDIAYKTAQPPKKLAYYYKLSLENDNDNQSVLFKLAKIYLKENKNILGIEYLKDLAIKTNDSNILMTIEKMVQNNITPKNKYEANNLYEILGIIYLKTGKTQDSLNAYNKAIILNPDDIYLKYQLGDLYYNLNCSNDAIEVYDSILKENINDSQIRLTKAELLLKKGNLLAANKEYVSILEDYPNSAAAKYGIYKIYERKLSPEKIVTKINTIENKNYTPTKADILAFATFLEQMNDIEGAKNFRNYISEIEKQNLISQKQNEPKKQIKPSTTKQTQDKKQTINKEKQNQIIAKKKQEELKKQQEQKLKKEEQKRQQEIKQNEYEQKAIAAERQKAINKDPKKYQEYKKIIDKYLAQNPKDTSVYCAIANTYRQMGEPTSALKYYRTALKQDPTNSDIYYNMGLVYLELNSLETAKANLIKAINLNKENTKALTLLSFVNQKIITGILNNAYSKFESKKYLEALKILDDGIKYYPKNAQIYYYRALVYNAMDRNAASIIDLQKAIDIDPSYYMAYYQLGKTYEKIGDERSALIAWERFLSIEPDEKELIQEIQKKVISLGEKYY